MKNEVKEGFDRAFTEDTSIEENEHWLKQLDTYKLFLILDQEHLDIAERFRFKVDDLELQKKFLGVIKKEVEKIANLTFKGPVFILGMGLKTDLEGNCIGPGLVNINWTMYGREDHFYFNFLVALIEELLHAVHWQNHVPDMTHQNAEKFDIDFHAEDVLSKMQRLGLVPKEINCEGSVKVPVPERKLDMLKGVEWIRSKP